MIKLKRLALARRDNFIQGEKLIRFLIRFLAPVRKVLNKIHFNFFYCDTTTSIIYLALN